MAKIRIRDRKLPSSAKTKKFYPVKFKNKVLKIITIIFIITNLIQSYYLFK